MLTQNHLSTASREDRQQADFELRTTDGIPGNPNAVRRAEFGRAEVRTQLFAGEDKLSIRLTAIDFLIGVVVSIDDELPFNGNRFVFVIIEVESPAEASRVGLARAVVHGRRPKRHHARGGLELRLHFLGIRIPKLVPTLADGPILGKGLTTRCGQQQYEKRQAAKAEVHGTHP